MKPIREIISTIEDELQQHGEEEVMHELEDSHVTFYIQRFSDIQLIYSRAKDSEIPRYTVSTNYSTCTGLEFEVAVKVFYFTIRYIDGIKSSLSAVFNKL